MQDDLDVWTSIGTAMGMYAGRDSMPSGSMVEDVRNDTFGERIQNEIESIDSTFSKGIVSNIFNQAPGWQAISSGIHSHSCSNACPKVEVILHL